MRKFLVVILFICSINSLKAQWQYTKGPYGGIINCMASLGNTIYAGTFNGLFYSADEGNSWFQVEGFDGVYINWIEANDSVIYVGDIYNGIGFSQDYGLSWDFIVTPYWVENIYYMSISGNMVFVTADSGFMKTENFGLSWTLLANDSLNSNFTTGMITLGNRILVGSGPAGIYTSDDYGNNWTSQNNGFPSTTCNSLTIDGSYLFAGTQNGVFMSADTGISWYPRSNGLNSLLVSSLITIDSTLYAVAGREVYVSVDHGLHWVIFNNGLEAESIWKLCFAGTKIYATAYFLNSVVPNGIFCTSHLVNNWIESNNGLLNTTVSKVTCSNNKLIANSNHYGFFVSHDYGDTWISSIPGFPIYPIDCFATKGDTIAACVSSIGIYLSTDCGNTWQISTSFLTYPPAYIISDIEIIGSKIYVLINDNEIYVTNDMGVSWSFLNNLSIFNLDACEGILYGNNSQRIYKMNSLTGNWDTIYNSFPNTWIRFVFAHNDYIYAYSMTDGILVSHNNGNTWILANNGLQGEYFTGLKLLGSNVVALTSQGRIYLTSNNGANWDLLTSTDPYNYLQYYSMTISDDYIYSGTRKGVIKYPLSSILGSIEGYIHYQNSSQTPISNVKVGLYQNGVLVAQTSSDLMGHYKLANIANGLYSIHCEVSNPWGGGNALDALRIIHHFAGLSQLNGLALQAADIDSSQSVNSVDALLVVKRYLGMISSFATGDWVTELNQVSVSGPSVYTKDIALLCTGDVDGSYPISP